MEWGGSERSLVRLPAPIQEDAGTSLARQLAPRRAEWDFLPGRKQTRLRKCAGVIWGCVQGCSQRLAPNYPPLNCHETRAHKSCSECSPLLLHADPFLLPLPKAFCWSPQRTDEDVVAAMRGLWAGAICQTGADKTGNRFLPPHALLGCCRLNEELKGRARAK